MRSASSLFHLCAAGVLLAVASATFVMIGASQAAAVDAVTSPADSIRPKARPEEFAEARNATIISRTTVSTKGGIVPPPALPPSLPLKVAMIELRKGNWDAAMEAAEMAGPVARDIVEWHRLRAGKGRFDQVLAFLERRPDWPGLAYLRRRSEGVVPYRARPDEVVDFFSERAPQTGAGLIVLAAALETLGDPEAAKPLLIRAWTEMKLSVGDERYLLERYGDLLKPHHIARMDYLLWEERGKAVERLMPRVPEGWRKLARARLALQDDRPGVDGLIAAVPADLAADAGLAYERFMWRVRKGRREAAADLILERAGTQEALGRPQAWSNWRRIFAREAMRNGNGQRAYQLASTHGLTSGSAYADLEWLSGYLALRYLDDPAKALEHFQNFRIVVETPISLGRAGYWEGRAHEALGDAEQAAMAYAFGAEYQTSYYGLLAAERAGLPMDPALIGREAYPPWRDTSFADSSVFEAAKLLHAAGEMNLSERFMTHLTESLPPEEQGALADFALALGEPHYALMIAKRAATMGITLPRAYYPVMDFGIGDLPVPAELALAIARRESEFDPSVRSGAGAIGLMQVMPGTAREVAGILGVSYDVSRLQNDPAYNARLGTTYLAELIEVFGTNKALVSAGYNAGPSRPIRWMGLYGDPRDPDVDPVDWVEHIPFRETRNYVMRVMESLPVYRARLTGTTSPIALTDALKSE